MVEVRSVVLAENNFQYILKTWSDSQDCTRHTLKYSRANVHKLFFGCLNIRLENNIQVLEEYF